MMFESRIVFATDFEGDVSAGLRLATRLAVERGATLVILHVVPVDVSHGEAILHPLVDLMSGQHDRRLAKLVPTDPGVPFQHVLEVGDPEERITAYVRNERADLLVLEARRRRALSQVWGRSLAQRLIQRASCPVVTYRAGTVPAVPHNPGVKPVSPSANPIDDLVALLDARVGALVNWMELRRDAVARVARARSVEDGVASLYRADRYGVGQTFTPRIREMLELELREHKRALGAIGVEVVCGGQTLLRWGRGAHSNPDYLHFVQRLRRQGASVSVPLEPAQDDPHESCVILAGSDLAISDDAPAHLLFTFDARRDFLRILAQPGPEPSMETYAFDRDGVMLSYSRFPEQLRRVGLLPAAPGAQTPRRLRVCDPGGDLLAGEVEPRAAAPLTRMAADATSGHDGSDRSGYRDYRGVEVIGAWRWIADYGFGVAAEMDRPGISPPNRR